MSKKYVIFFMMLMLLCISPGIAAATPWDGTVDTDWYTGAEAGAESFEIGTPAQLAGLASLVNDGTDNFAGKTVKLTADLDLGGVNDGGVWDAQASKPWIPIGTSSSGFKGTFDGNGKKITNLYISAATVRLGLFGTVDNGEVHSLALASGSVSYTGTSTSAYAGGIAAYATNSSFIDCFNNADVVNARRYSGGILAYGSQGAIVNCGNSGDISGTRFVGGICGMAPAIVVNCYNSGKAAATDTPQALVGGIAGRAASLVNCYSYGEVVTVGQYAGMLVGDSNVTAANCYYLYDQSHTMKAAGTAAASVDVAGATAKNATELKDSAAALGALFAADDDAEPQNSGYPILGWQKTGVYPVREIADATVTKVSDCAVQSFKVYLNKALLYTSLKASDLKVTVNINGGAAEERAIQSLTPSKETVDGAEKTVITVKMAESFVPVRNEQSIVYNVTLRESQAVSGPAFTVEASTEWYEHYSLEAPEGDGTAEKPYRLGSAEDLAWFMRNVNNNITARSAAILTANIDLGGKSWTPIGNSKTPYGGVFRGNGHTVSNLSFGDPRPVSTGLFGEINGSTIENLTVEGALNVKSSTLGGLVGTAKKSTIRGCVNKVEFSYDAKNILYVGGIAGSAVETTIEGCVNYAGIAGGHRLGGIAGQAQKCTIKNSENHGAIRGDTGFFGGIVGEILGGAVSGCTNHKEASLQAIGTAAVGNLGGIVGRCEGSANIHERLFYDLAIIENCLNEAVLEPGGQSYTVGGIVGHWGAGQVRGCVNHGDVSAADTRVGGIIGAMTPYNVTKDVVLSKCVNHGDVSAGGAMAGGLVGDLSGSGTNPIAGIVEESANHGNVTVGGGDNAGGLIGSVTTLNNPRILRHCYHTGAAISGANYVGGLIGSISDTSGTANPYSGVYVEHCYSLATKVKATQPGGVSGAAIGLLSSDRENVTIQHVYYSAAVNNDSALGRGSTDSKTLSAYDAAAMATADFAATMGRYFQADKDGTAGINNGYPILVWQAGKEVPAAQTGTVTISVLDNKNAAFPWKDVKLNVYPYAGQEAVAPAGDGVYELPLGIYRYHASIMGYTACVGKFTVEKDMSLTIKVIERAKRGTVDNPHQIGNVEELAAFAESVNSGNTYLNEYVVLTKDIDLAGADWIPIGYNDSNIFRGTFDGQGHTVSNLTCEDYDYTGFFGVTNGTVKNLKLTNVALKGPGHVGGLIAYTGTYNSYTPSQKYILNVSNCYVDGKIVISAGSALTSYAGGLVAQTASANINGCAFVGDITVAKERGDANCYLSGLAGITYATGVNNNYVTNCYVAANILGPTHNKVDGAGLGTIAYAHIVNNCVVGALESDGTYISGITAAPPSNKVNSMSGNVSLMRSIGKAGNAGKAHRLHHYTGLDIVLDMNYGYQGMLVNGAALTVNTDELLKYNGADIDAAKALKAQTYIDMGWDASLWTLKDGSLPYLTALGPADTAQYGYLLDDYAAYVEGLIAAIGAVGPQSGGAIQAAREAYDSLEESFRVKVKNYQTLTAAEEAYGNQTYRLKFHIVPEGASFTLNNSDGQALNPNGDGSFTVKGGAYVLNATKEGYENYQETLTIPGSYAVSEIGEINLNAVMSKVLGTYTVDLSIRGSNYSLLLKNSDGETVEGVANPGDGTVSNRYTLKEGIYEYGVINKDGVSLGGGQFLADSNATVSLHVLAYSDAIAETKKGTYSMKVTRTLENGAVLLYTASQQDPGSFLLPILNDLAAYDYEIIPDDESYFGSYGYNYVFADSNFKPLNLSDDGRFTIGPKMTMEVQIPIRNVMEFHIYHRVKFYQPLEEITLGEADLEKHPGFATYTITVAENENLFYEIREEGYIKKSQSFDTSDYLRKSLIVELSQKTSAVYNKPDLENDLFGNMYIVSDIVASVGEDNFMELEQGSYVRPRFHRNWQAPQASGYVEPAYHYEVISGNSVSISDPYEAGCRINASAENTGVSIVRVTYDAMEVNGRFYSSLWPYHCAYLVFNVVTPGESPAKGIEIKRSFTGSIYYTASINGEDEEKQYAEYTFTPQVEDGSAVTVRVHKPVGYGAWGDGEWETYAADTAVDKAFTVKLYEGNNVIEVATANGGLSYHVMKCMALDLKIENLTTGKFDNIYYPGNEVKITFDGIEMPLVKLMAISNPGYPNQMYVEYKLDGIVYEGERSQYDLAKKNALYLNLGDEDGTQTLTNGKIHGNSFGGTPDAAGNSAETTGYYCLLPNIDLKVQNSAAASDLDKALYAQIMGTDSALSMNSTKIPTGAVNLQEWPRNIVYGNYVEALNTTDRTITAKIWPRNSSNVTVVLRYWTESDPAPKIVYGASGKNLITEAFSKYGDITYAEIICVPRESTGAFARAYSLRVSQVNGADYPNPYYGAYPYLTALSLVLDEDAAAACVGLDGELRHESTVTFKEKSWLLDPTGTERTVGLGYGFLGTETAYKVTLPYEVDEIKMKATALQETTAPTIALSANGATQTLVNGQACGESIALAPGATTEVTVTATLGEKTKTYTLKVYRKAGPKTVAFSISDVDASLTLKNASNQTIAPQEDGTYLLNSDLYTYYLEKTGYYTGIGSFIVEDAGEASQTVTVPALKPLPAQSGNVKVNIIGHTSYLKTNYSVDISGVPADLTEMKYVDYNYGGYTALHALIDASSDKEKPLAFKCRKGVFKPSVSISNEGHGANAGWICEVNGIAVDPAKTLVKSDDEIILYYSADMKDMRHAYFEHNTLSVEAGKEVALMLSATGIANDGTAAVPVEDALIKINGRGFADNYTDAQGKMTLPAFDTPGVYIVTAEKENDDAENCLTYAACIITVTKAEMEARDTTTVSFRLIGDTVHDSFARHSCYVTWIASRTYDFILEEGEELTVGDVFARAMDSADLSYVGLEKNYISEIQAPQSLGGYRLGEFDNGQNSGWMYTVNGLHSQQGLNDTPVADGDAIIWHYADDYDLEQMDKPGATATHPNRWLEAEDTEPPYITAAIAIYELPGKITLGDKVAIETARASYEKLSAADKSHLPADRLTKLTAAEAALKQLEEGGPVDPDPDQVAADAAIAKIAAIGEVTANSGDAILAARTVYDALSDAQKNLVTNLDVLTAAEKAFKELEEEPEPSPVVRIEDMKDIPATAWYYNDVAYVLVKGIMKGTSATTFGPNEPITRGQFVTILGRYAGISDSGSAQPAQTKFSDVKATAYYASHVAWAVENGITKGTGETTFAPEAKISRQDMATMIARFAKTMEIGLPDGSGAKPFSDDKEISSYAKTTVYSMVEAEIIDGIGNNRFAPKDSATRSQAAKIIHLLMEYQG